LIGEKCEFWRMLFCTCARSFSNDIGLATGVRVLEKKRWFSARFEMVERAAGRPLICVL
jgi:hypothetical protein